MPRNTAAPRSPSLSRSRSRSRSGRNPTNAAATPTLATQAAQAVDGLKEVPKAAEARVKALIESGRPAIKRAQALVKETGRTLSKQTSAIRENIAHRVSDLGTRVEKERKSIGRKVESAVKTTLASLNIPTRSEINLLARRVEELSLKIDSLKRK